MVRIVKRTADVVTSILLGALLLGSAAIALAILVPRLLGNETYVIDGTSMSGTYNRGSIVIEKRTPAADLKVGDVITYLPPASSGVHHLVTHRIAAISADDDGKRLYRTKGDANATADPWRFTLDAPTQVHVVHSVPLVGYALIALNNPNTRRMAIAVPAVLIGLVALVELVGVFRPDASPALTPAAAD
jgi:signal peptidase